MSNQIIRPISTKTNTGWDHSLSAHSYIDDVVSYPSIPNTDKITSTGIGNLIFDLDDIYSTYQPSNVNIRVYVEYTNNTGELLYLSASLVSPSLSFYGGGYVVYSNTIESFTGWVNVSFSTSVNAANFNFALLKFGSIITNGSLSIHAAYVDLTYSSSTPAETTSSATTETTAKNEDLKFYLTNIEENTYQSNISQSLGGYPSLTKLNESSILENAITINDSSANTINGIETPNALLIDSEIIEVSGSGNDFTLTTRGFASTNARPHAMETDVIGLLKNQFFNNLFINEKQYRCIAIKNEGNFPFYFMKVFLKSESLNTNCFVKFAIEIPKNDLVESIAIGGSNISIIDTSLINYDDNYFENQLITFTSGNNINLKRKVVSFDSESGTITFNTSVPYTVNSGDEYIIEPSPSSTIINSGTSPETGTNYITNFYDITNLEDAIDINVNNNRINGSHLYPNEIFYIWFERTLSDNIEKFENNRIILAFSYQKNI